MTYPFDPYGRSRPRTRQSPAPGTVSLADFQKLQQIAEEISLRLDKALAENKQLQGEVDRLAKEVRHKTQELEIKNEALRTQSEHQKQIETELVFVKAALEDERAKAAENEEEASWQERYLRLQAELENLRRRLEQRAAAESADNRRRILADMLPLADHLDLALQHRPQMDDVQVANFIGNIDATRRAFLETLRRYGVERIEPQNEMFDPNRHEAIGQAPSPEVPADHVAQVVQAGYADGERILRPARVLVSTGAGE